MKNGRDLRPALRKEQCEQICTPEGNPSGVLSVLVVLLVVILLIVLLVIVLLLVVALIVVLLLVVFLIIHFFHLLKVILVWVKKSKNIH